MGPKQCVNPVKLSALIIVIVVACIGYSNANIIPSGTVPTGQFNVSCIVTKLKTFEDAMMNADTMQNIKTECQELASVNITVTKTTTNNTIAPLSRYFNEYVFPWGILSSSLSIACSLVVIVLFGMLKFLRSPTNSLLFFKAIFDILTAVFIIVGLNNLKFVFSCTTCQCFWCGQIDVCGDDAQNRERWQCTNCTPVFFEDDDSFDVVVAVLM